MPITHCPPQPMVSHPSMGIWLWASYLCRPGASCVCAHDSCQWSLLQLCVGCCLAGAVPSKGQGQEEVRECGSLPRSPPQSSFHLSNYRINYVRQQSDTECFLKMISLLLFFLTYPKREIIFLISSNLFILSYGVGRCLFVELLEQKLCV